jgi:hypothetical protein
VANYYDSLTLVLEPLRRWAALEAFAAFPLNAEGAQGGAVGYTRCCHQIWRNLQDDQDGTYRSALTNVLYILVGTKVSVASCRPRWRRATRILALHTLRAPFLQVFNGDSQHRQ